VQKVEVSSPFIRSRVTTAALPFKTARKVRAHRSVSVREHWQASHGDIALLARREQHRVGDRGGDAGTLPPPEPLHQHELRQQHADGAESALG
jgi:hypothetical protein